MSALPARCPHVPAVCPSISCFLSASALLVVRSFLPGVRSIPAICPFKSLYVADLTQVSRHKSVSVLNNVKLLEID
jgi:hypothetical protein